MLLLSNLREVIYNLPCHIKLDSRSKINLTTTHVTATEFQLLRDEIIIYFEYVNMLIKCHTDTLVVQRVVLLIDWYNICCFQ